MRGVRCDGVRACAGGVQSVCGESGGADDIVGCADLGCRAQEIEVIYKEPGKAPEVMVIDNELSEFQRLVKGYIEPITIGDAIILVNEEGKLQGLAPNCYLMAAGNCVDVLVGPVIVCGDDGEEFGDVPENVKEDILAGKSSVFMEFEG